MINIIFIILIGYITNFLLLTFILRNHNTETVEITNIARYSLFIPYVYIILVPIVFIYDIFRNIYWNIKTRKYQKGYYK